MTVRRGVRYANVTRNSKKDGVKNEKGGSAYRRTRQEGEGERKKKEKGGKRSQELSTRCVQLAGGEPRIEGKGFVMIKRQVIILRCNFHGLSKKEKE